MLRPSKIKQLLTEYIGDNDNDIEEFNSMLIDNCAAVSGSFALRLLINNDDDNRHYEESDMDIYVGDYDHSHGVIGHLETSGWHVTAETNSSYPITNEYTLHMTTLVHGSTNKKIKVCMIEMEEEGVLSPDEAICLYDFTFLMNYYDGANVCSAFPADVETKKGKVFNIKTLNNKRITKYIKRGFKILIDEYSLINKSIEDVDFKLIDIE
jgi:ABC-type antimicrobial peptide transport system permease subunit